MKQKLRNEKKQRKEKEAARDIDEVTLEKTYEVVTENEVTLHESGESI